MGAIAKAKQETAVAAPNKGMTFGDLVKRATPQFQSVMPEGFKAERLTQMAISAYNQTPKLAECEVSSILSCCLRAASLGLEPSAVDGLGRAYILPYSNHGRMQAQFILGKNGMIELVQRSGQVKSIRTQCVYEGDEFDYWEDEDGVHMNYRPNLTADHSDKNLKLVYVSAHLKDGGFAFLAMSKDECDAVKARSKAANASFSPWKSDYAAMCEKTVLRRAFNRGILPRSVTLAQALNSDETTPDPIQVDGFEVFAEPEVEETTQEAVNNSAVQATPVVNVNTETGEVIE